MVALRERRTRAAFRPVAPVGQLLGEPRFRWGPLAGAWLYRVELTDARGQAVGRGWSGMHELPLAWLHGAEGAPPRLAPGHTYRWRVYAYNGGPDGPPSAAALEAEFIYLGP